MKQQLLEKLQECLEITNGIAPGKFASLRGVELLTLKEFIDKYHEGNQSAYAVANNKARQQVGQQLEADFIVVDGDLYRLAKKALK